MLTALLVNLAAPVFHSSISLLGLTILVAHLLVKLSKIGKREPFLPPGPSTAPLVGNALQIPTKSPQHRFTEWGREYGEIYSLKLANATVVVLSSFNAIRQVMEKSSAVTSDRPPFHFVALIEGENNNVVFGRYTQRWRSLRRAAREVLSAHACKNHLGVQHAEAVQLAHDLLDDMEIRSSLRRTTTSIIMSVLFGMRVPRITTPIFVEFWDMLNRFVDLTAPTSHPPVDLIPILRKVPERFASWKTECRELRVSQRAVFKKMLQPVKERLARGESLGCFMEEVCQRADEWGLDDEAILYFGGAMMEAGSDTTSVFFQNFVLLLAAYPDIQWKAQQELDEVVGPHRMPVLDDFQNLPYIEALINEAHRFRTVAPLSVPHATTEDVRYEDYIIPKGSMVFQNTWGLFRDESVFQEPERFRPERFLENPDLAKYIDYAFGSGRRVCVGDHLAKSSIIIIVMNILWCFDTIKARDSHGKEIEPDLTNYEEGLINIPTNLECAFKPRNANCEAILRQTFYDTKDVFEPLERELREEYL